MILKLELVKTELVQHTEVMNGLSFEIGSPSFFIRPSDVDASGRGTICPIIVQSSLESSSKFIYAGELAGEILLCEDELRVLLNISSKLPAFTL